MQMRHNAVVTKCKWDIMQNNIMQTGHNANRTNTNPKNANVTKCKYDIMQ